MMALSPPGVEFPMVPVGGRVQVHYEDGGRTTLVFSEARCTVYHFCRFCGRNFSAAWKVDRCEDEHRRHLEVRAEADARSLTPH